jgi:hypothetical protein
MIAIYFGVFIGLVAPLRLELFGKNTLWQPLGDAITTLGQPVVCLHTLLMWASLSKVDLFGYGKPYTEVTREQSDKADVVSAMHVNSPSPSGIESNNSIVESERRSVGAATLDATETIGVYVAKPHWRAVLAVLVCRSVVSGFAVIPLILLFLNAGFIDSKDRMLQLVIVLQAVAPPAQMVIVTLSQLSLPDIASAMAYIYIFQYLASVFTVTVWVTLALSIFY